MSEGLQFLIGLCITTLVLFLSLGVIGHIENQHEEHMASIGYVEVQALGTKDTLWVKED